MTKELKQEANDFVNTSSTIYKRVIGWDNYQRGAYIGYLAGAESREKRIAELEDERSDLDMIAKNYAIKIANLKKSCDETQELLDKQIEATYKLDKENAELKDDNKVMADNYSKMEQKFYDNLTKAKEHIENLLYYVKQCTCERSNYAEIEEDIKQAEQFLSCKEILNN